MINIMLLQKEDLGWPFSVNFR